MIVMTPSGWNYTQGERDWAIEEVDCPTCEVPAGDPCVGVSRGSKKEIFEYQQYAHDGRMQALFADEEKAG